MKRPVFSVFLSAALLLGGCAGYHLGPAKPISMDGINTIAVPSFKNDTLLPRLEVPLADIMIKQIQQDGTYKIAEEGNADATLLCTVEKMDRVPYRALLGNVLQTTEFQLNLTIDFKLIKRTTGAVLVHRTVVGKTEFFVGGDLQQDEQQAIPLAGEKAAVAIVSALSEGF